MVARTTDRPPLAWVVTGGVLTVTVLTVVWISLAGQLDAQDLVAGSITGLVATALGFLVSQEGRALPGLRVGDLRQIAAIPKRIVVESGQVFAVAARKAVTDCKAITDRKAMADRGATGGTTEGSWAHEPVDAAGGGWSTARRDSALTALLSVSPGTIVVDIDADSGVALVHRLGRKRRADDDR